jgi:hypothetical protein
MSVQTQLHPTTATREQLYHAVACAAMLRLAYTLRDDVAFSTIADLPTQEKWPLDTFDMYLALMHSIQNDLNNPPVTPRPLSEILRQMFTY